MSIEIINDAFTLKNTLLEAINLNGIEQEKLLLNLTKSLEAYPLNIIVSH